MCAYVAGLIATIIAMNVFLAAQPALLYLVPACLLTVLAMAAAKGEVKELWNYAEVDEEEEEKGKDGKAVETDDRQDDNSSATTADNGLGSLVAQSARGEPKTMPPFGIADGRRFVSLYLALRSGGNEMISGAQTKKRIGA
jgi:hypothetical protein